MITITDQDINTLELETELQFDEARRNILKSYSDVQACPGSGKTTLVAAKLILLAKKWECTHRGVCVLSHTNVAKDEIIDRLKKHPKGHTLLDYPHFIGTIQEFANKFLGIPYCRSRSILVNQIDDELCCGFIERNLTPTIRAFRGNQSRKAPPPLSDLQIHYVNGEFQLNVPGFSKKSPSPSYRDFENIKRKLIVHGYHFYYEIFEYGKACLNENPCVADAIRYRFPIAFIDEMQDTSALQDEILCGIFKHESCFLQRYGDPDQSIFEGSSPPNTSYNNANHSIIRNSHRFCPTIANLASGLSNNGISITSTKAVSQELPHTIYLVDEASRETVIPAFAALCAENQLSTDPAPIKVVGAIGNENPDGLTIRHYYPGFDKSKASRSFRPSKFIHYIYKAKSLLTGHSADSYRTVLEGVVRCARAEGLNLSMPDGGTRPYTVDNMKLYLKVKGTLRDFNTQYLKILETNLADPEQWREYCGALLHLAGITADKEDTRLFITHVEPEEVQPQEIPLLSNTLRYNYDNQNIEVEVATIHSVKGETHSATLILETKFYEFDIGCLLDRLLKRQSRRTMADRKKRLMKQLYVAMTRPKHLVCLAMDKSRISADDRTLAETLGWTIVDLT